MRVDVGHGNRLMIWTNDEIASCSVSNASLITGLAYAVPKRGNYRGVNA